MAREIMRNLPHERIVYFGDTARVPYGSKSRETVIRYSRQIVRFLKTQEVKAIVVACNTASALALETIQQETDIPMLGVVEPGARVAAKTTRNKKIGLIGTRATVKSDLYRTMIQKTDPQIQVIGQACPLFVPLVEEGWLKDSVTIEVARRYLKPLLEQDIDTLILGCTHYPLIRSTLRRIMGDGVELVNPAYETAIELKNLLEREGLSCNENCVAEEKYQFYVSDLAEKFKNIATAILPEQVKETLQIPIEEY